MTFVVESPTEDCQRLGDSLECEIGRPGLNPGRRENLDRKSSATARNPLLEGADLSCHAVAVRERNATELIGVAL